MERLTIDIPKVRKGLVQFIHDHVQRSGFNSVVLGLSGGLDSSVSAYLAVEALGRKNCTGVFLPHKQSNPDSLKDAQLVADELRIETRLVDITGFVESFAKSFPQMTKLQLGNVMARCRMISLYQISAELNSLVLGTSNKSEILLGYGTLFGDLACALDPLGDLYKTEIRALAEDLGVPARIIEKAPSADLWEGQSDEGELGITYAEADRLFARWIEEGYAQDELISDGFKPQFIERVMNRVNSQRFKSTPPPIPTLASLIKDEKDD